MEEPIMGKILFEIDPLSAWFILIINITLINGAFYGIGYMAPYASRKNDLSFHWVLLLFSMPPCCGYACCATALHF